MDFDRIVNETIYVIAQRMRDKEFLEPLFPLDEELDGPTKQMKILIHYSRTLLENYHRALMEELKKA